MGLFTQTYAPDISNVLKENWVNFEKLCSRKYVNKLHILLAINLTVWINHTVILRFYISIYTSAVSTWKYFLQWKYQILFREV
jgi:hypothetical protein